MDYFVVVVVVSELRDGQSLFLTHLRNTTTYQGHEIIVNMQLRVDTTLALMPRDQNQVQVTQHGRLP
jgi:hypothetical protein